MKGAAWFLIGCITAALQVFAPIRGGFGRGWEMLNVARTLAEKGYYGDPFAILATGPTAMVPPAYPLLLSVFVRLFGDTSLFAWSAIVLCVLVHGLYSMLLPEVGARLLDDRRSGEAAAALACLIPAFPLMPQWDTMFTTCGILLYLLAANPSVEQGRRWFGIGALAGLLSLWNPISLPVTFLRTLWVMPHTRKAVFWMGAWSAGALLAAGPWIARNHAELDTWNTRTNFGTTLFVSNNDCAQPGLLGTIRTGCYDQNHPNKSLSEARLIVELGEAAYDARRTRDTLLWMKAHPRRTSELALGRFLEYWFPSAEQQTPYSQAVWLTTLLALGGFAWMVRDHVRVTRFLAALSLLLPLPYYFVVADIRYRAPILWVSQLCAGYFLVRFSLWCRCRRWVHRY